MNTIKRTLIAFLFVFLFVEAENDSSLNRKKPLSLKGTKVHTWVMHPETTETLDKTRLDDGHHLSHVQLRIEAVDGRSWTINLQLNHQLLTKEFFTKHQKNGQHVIHKPQTHEVDLCQYQGSVIRSPNTANPSKTWAAISTCDNRIRGVFYDGHRTYHLHDSEWLYDEQQELTHNHQPLRCGHVSKNEKHYGFVSQRKRLKREASESTIRGPYNANVHSRYVELVLVVDNKVYKDLDESLDRVYQHCKDIGNIINKLYQPLNIFVALVGVVVWSESDEIALSSNGDSTLSNFLTYRREKLVREHPNDNAQLLTGVQFQDGVVGKALKGPMCTFEFSGGVNMDHSTVVGLVAATVAHEMGHNFGMEHDTAECNCTRERCIMAPSSSPIGPTSWSQCSLNYLALAFEHGMDYCLRNRPTRLFDGPVCGNGFVEPGEQCDCGLLERCDNPCCEPKTCMLRRNASCATGECCDLNLCRPKSPGTLCRPADAHECDLPEYCTGQSEYCPQDVYKLDGTACQQSKAYCFRGQCRTHSDQCRLLWGYSGHSSEQQCYAMNIKGTRHGNCGYNLMNKSYVKCQEQDIACGMLHCKHINEKLEFGMESVAILSHSFINSKGSIIPCRSALVDLGLNQADPGLAPDGAKCGAGKMCVNQKCMSVESLRRGMSCPNNCNDNGVCNSLGHCHCNKGFAPPLCDYPGTGGSIDSGPAPEPQESSQWIWVLICMALVLFVIGTFLYINCHRQYFCFQRAKHFHPCFKINNTKSSIPPPTAPPPSSDDAHGSSNFKPSSVILPGPGNTLINPTSESNHLIGDYKKFIINPISTKIPANSNSSLTSSSKPLISSPVLAATTCTAPEVAGVTVPTRPAPLAPPVAVKSATKPDTENNFKSSPLSSLSTSESREYPELIKLASLQRRQEITRKPTRTSLRDLDISAPIPQGEITIAQNALPVSRAQSLRTANNPPRQGIQSFGSMRQPTKRPSSIPPPPPPNPSKQNDVPPPLPPPFPVPSNLPAPIEQNEYCYDDCSSDPRHQNAETPIYAVIEESTPTPTPSANHSSGSAESVGLLSEIVNEIHNRNIESIYNSSLGRKGNKNSSEYIGGSESSSGGYLNPTKLDAPNKNPTSESPNLSTASTFSSSSSSSADNQTPLLPPANTIVNPTSQNKKSKPLNTSDISKPIVNPSTKPKPQSFNTKSSINPNKNQLSGRSITASDISKPINLINSTKTLTNAENIKPVNSTSPTSTVSSSNKPNLKTSKPSAATSKPSTASKPTTKSLTSKDTTNSIKLEPTRKAPLVPNTSTPPWRQQQQQQEQQHQKRNSNSPDVVSSCSPNTNSKSVLSSSRPPDVIGARGPLASSVANRSNNTGTKPSTINTVASLQQRFEAASRGEDKTNSQIRSVIAPPIKPRPSNTSASKTSTQTK